MAKEHVLARSYYQWLEKSGLELPEHLSTDSTILAKSTASLCESVDPQQQERAQYWHRIFSEKAQERLMEGVILDKLRKLLRPSTNSGTPKDPIILKTIRGALQKARKAAEEIGQYREGMWTYRAISKWYKEDELIAMSRALDYPVEEKDIEDVDYTRKRYKRWVWLMALNPFNVPHLFRDILELGLAPIEVTIATLVWLLKKAYGEKVAEDVTNQVFT